MRERRWESRAGFQFSDVTALGGRLARLGLRPATPEKEIIVYVEEWTVPAPGEINRLSAWSKEDVTLVHVREGWRGDFFLLAGGYHTLFQRHAESGTYCSVSHPWQMQGRWLVHHPRGMFWVGFRDRHAFIRVRLHTTEVITPDETREDDRRDLWTSERRLAFQSAIALLDLPIETDLKNGKVLLQATEPTAALLCSWPDAFGPCQFEYNGPDTFEFLVPAGRLAATCGGEAVTVRAYLTGFSEPALKDFETTGPGARYAYRCSVHAQLQDLPELLSVIRPDGRLYTTLCEFQTRELYPSMESAWVIIGAVGTDDGYAIEARLNRAPLPENEMDGWLETLLGFPMTYAPLPPFA
ncbi:MAG TPA: hypothetical protein VLY20_10965 [Nitrospiria bacterium]|nr:hypothetical protein [Nitrospiria bacterium]